MPEGISRFVKPRPGHPPSDAYNVAFAAKNGAKVVEGGERERERNEEEGEGERVRAEKTIYLFCPNERKRGPSWWSDLATKARVWPGDGDD